MIVRVDAVRLDLVRAIGLTDVTGVLLDQPALVLAVLELDAFAGGSEVGPYITRSRVGGAGARLGDVGDESRPAPREAAVGGFDHGGGDDVAVRVIIAELAAAKALVLGVDEEREDLACLRVVDVGGIAVAVFRRTGVSHVACGNHLHRPPRAPAVGAAPLDDRVGVGCVRGAPRPPVPGCQDHTVAEVGQRRDAVEEVVRGAVCPQVDLLEVSGRVGWAVGRNGRGLRRNASGKQCQGKGSCSGGSAQCQGCAVSLGMWQRD